VRDEHDRLVELVLQPQGLLLQIGAHDRVDGAERFVHEQDVRVGGETAGHTHALLLTARELAGVALGELLVETDRVEQLTGARVRLGLLHAVQTQHG
jgi:hypothetical protein